MINVKGARAENPESPAQRYVLKNVAASRTPLAFGMFLTGVALFLKSIFPSLAQLTDQPQGSEEGAVGKAQPRIAEMKPAESGLNGSLSEPMSDTASSSRVEGFSGRILAPASSVDFNFIDPPALDFLKTEIDESWNAVKASPKETKAANDNLGGASGGGGAKASLDKGGRVPEHEDGPGDEGGAEGADPGGSDPGPQKGAIDVPDGEESEQREDEDEDEDEETHSSSPNRAPRTSGPVYLMDVTSCAILAIGWSDLLKNAADPDGDELAIQNVTVSSGALTRTMEGWAFQGDPRSLGPVIVSYQITDGEFTIEQTAHFSIIPSSIIGSAGDDILIGGMCAEEIDGGEGDDNIDGRAGFDIIAGGGGADHIIAGAGDDIVFGGGGDDIIFGGAGNDQLSGGDGDDRLYGDAGDDIIFGEEGDDLVRGGAGADLLFGGAGEDVIYGDVGDDVIEGGCGADMLRGGSGDDAIEGGEGNDVICGGDGNDSISGGEDDDALDGGGGDDVLNGSAGDDLIAGCAGDDLIRGGSGNDVLYDGDGEDVVLGGAGEDRVVAALDAADDVYSGGEGCDTLEYSNALEAVTFDLVSGVVTGLEIGEDSISGFENVVGGEGDDHFIIGKSAVILKGGGGDNSFHFDNSFPTEASAPVMHEIIDFKAGDRIRMSKYDIFEEVCDELEDEFEEVYGDDIDSDEIPIRYRHDQTDEMDRTIIEADFNRDEIYETTIELHGRHALVIVEYV